MDKLYISITIFLGIWAVAKELFFSTDTGFGFFIVCTCIVLMIRSIVWYQATEREYVRVLNSALCQSNLSRDQDTILSLVDSVDEQEFMEKEFGENINVMIEGAMSKLTELGLFESGGDSKEESIRVKSLLDAVSCAHQHYQSAIQSVRKIGGVDKVVSDEPDDKEEKKEDVEGKGEEKG